jgi:hypothetical protein
MSPLPRTCRRFYDRPTGSNTLLLQKTRAAIIVLLLSTCVPITSSHAAPNGEPSVTLVQPAAGSTLYKGYAATVRADADDTDGFIREVSFYADNKLVKRVLNPPYIAHVTPSSTGPLLITVLAVDDRGAVTRSQSAFSVRLCSESQTCDEELSAADTLCCLEPPTVQWVSPAGGAPAHVARDVTLEIATSSTTAGIDRVDFYVGDELVGSVKDRPYRTTWRPRAAGAFTLRAHVITADQVLAHSAPNHVVVK